MSEPPFSHEPEKRGSDAPNGDSALIGAIPRHFLEIFGEVQDVIHETESEFIHLDLFEFEPVPVRGTRILVTCGMAEKPMNVPKDMKSNPDDYRYAELILHLPAEWPMEWDDLIKPVNFWLIQVMKSFARLPHEREGWVWGGHTLSNGENEPYAADTGLCAALLCPSLHLPSQFEVMTIGDRRVVFLTLTFLYREELEFTKKHHSDALLKRFEDSGLSPIEFFVLDKHRKNICA